LGSAGPGGFIKRLGGGGGDWGAPGNPPRERLCTARGITGAKNGVGTRMASATVGGWWGRSKEGAAFPCWKGAGPPPSRGNAQGPFDFSIGGFEPAGDCAQPLPGAKHIHPHTMGGRNFWQTPSDFQGKNIGPTRTAYPPKNASSTHLVFPAPTAERPAWSIVGFEGGCGAGGGTGMGASCPKSPPGALGNGLPRRGKGVFPRGRGGKRRAGGGGENGGSDNFPLGGGTTTTTQRGRGPPMVRHFAHRATGQPRLVHTWGPLSFCSSKKP